MANVDLHLTDHERLCLRKMRALEVVDGQERLVGLTLHESLEYIRLTDQRVIFGEDQGEGLLDKHECARLQRIDAEREARYAGPKH